MIRYWLCLTLLVIAQPAWAGDGDAPYYGPMKRWHGIGFKFGYEDRTEKDGSWRIDTAIHGRGEAIDMALYRAAERARDEGYRYLFILGGSGSTSPGIDAATVYARPSHEAVSPIGCRSKRVSSCYTADVAEVLRSLGGLGGTQPGMPVMDHRDESGREVFLSGYGVGGIATLVPGGVARSHVMTIAENRSEAKPVANTPIVRMPVPAPRGAVTLAGDDRFEQALKINQPVRGRDPKQGWTISD